MVRINQAKDGSPPSRINRSTDKKTLSKTAKEIDLDTLVALQDRNTFTEELSTRNNAF